MKRLARVVALLQVRRVTPAINGGSEGAPLRRCADRSQRDMRQREPAALIFTFLNRSLRVRYDRSEVGAYLEHAYADLRTSTPLRGRLDCGEIVCPAGSETHVLFNGRRIAIPALHGNDDPLAAAFYGAAELFAASFRNLPAHDTFYGAGLAAGDGAILLSAPSGTGKTTLALECLRRGARFYADEFVFVERSTARVRGFSRTLMVREETRDLIGDTALQALLDRSALHKTTAGKIAWRLIGAHDAFGERVLAEPLPLRHIVLLKRRASRACRLSKISAAECVLELLPRTFFARLQPADIWGLLERYAGAACYRLEVGDPGEAATVLLDAIANCRCASTPAA